MSLRKWLIKINNRLESTWSVVDTQANQVDLQAGWYVAEYIVQGTINHTPRLIIERVDAMDFERSLTGFHSGRNRMLVCLPNGKLKAYSRSLEFIRLARVSNLEGRARVLLICGRYLVDFFSLPVLVKMIVMQFQNRYDLSNSVLNFYSPVKETYLQNVVNWSRFRGFGNFLTWLGRGVKIAVLIESDAQRHILNELLVRPDYILTHADAVPKNVDYVLPLKASERLRDPAILMLKRCVKSAKTKPVMVYTDHDYEFDEKAGQKAIEPVFKPQPSQAYLHCFNYVGPAVMYSAKLIASAPLEDLLDDAKQYKLSLAAFTNTAAVVHLSEVLFVSQRQHGLATPEPLSVNSAWPNISWQRNGEHNTLSAAPDWNELPSVDLIIPTRDGLAVLKPCIESLLSITDYPSFHIIIADNGSEEAATHEYFAKISTDDRIRIVEYPGEFNYSAINNFAVAHGNSDYVALVNNDIEVIHPEWLRNMMVWAVQPEVGIVGAKLLFGNGLVQHAGVMVGMGNAAGHIHRLEEGDSPGYQNRCIATQNMMAVTAACLITPRTVFESFGGLNEKDFKVAYNDIDYCLRVESSGKQVIWTPEARLYHHESVSRGDDMADAHVERYFSELAVLQKRWKTKGFVDKFYSKHLRITDEGVYPQIESTERDQLYIVGSNATSDLNTVVDSELSAPEL
jgi:GT2 family glycosyltransferase